MLTLSWAHMKLYRNTDELLEMQILFGLLIKIANIKKKQKSYQLNKKAMFFIYLPNLTKHWNALIFILMFCSNSFSSLLSFIPLNYFDGIIS